MKTLDLLDSLYLDCLNTIQKHGGSQVDAMIIYLGFLADAILED